MPELNHTRFGTLEYAENDVLNFSEGLIGFAHCRSFIFVQTQAGGPFRWLQSLDEPSLAFLVVDPAAYVEGYAVELADDEAAALGIGPETATMLLTTASIPASRPQDMTLNLAGPIVLNAETRSGKQFVVEDERYAFKHRVFLEAPTKASSAKKAA
jgi:flagellar assembly factor FliW